MTIVVTAATGKLGQLVVRQLLEVGVAPDQIVATGRRIEALSDVAAAGVQVRVLDYADPTTFGPALAGVQRLLLISGTDFGQRVQQHAAVARAAQDAGAELVAYTSGPHAATSSMLLLADHRETERELATLDVPVTILRNGWYLENYTEQIPTYLATGVVIGAAGDGRVSGAARADYAAAAVAVLTGSGHEGAVYELGGDESFTLADVARLVSARTGKDIAYQDVSVAELQAVLESVGLPTPVAATIADVDRGVRAGELVVDSGDLARLIGRAPQTLEQAVAQWQA